MDIASRPAKEAQHSEQVDQDKTEDVARTPYSSQDQDRSESWNKIPYSSQDQDTTQDVAVHKEAQRILRMMKEALMPKKTQCSSQDQDKTEEAHRLDQTDQRQQERDMEFTKQQQDQETDNK